MSSRNGHSKLLLLGAPTYSSAINARSGHMGASVATRLRSSRHLLRELGARQRRSAARAKRWLLIVNLRQSGILWHALRIRHLGIVHPPVGKSTGECPLFGLTQGVTSLFSAYENLLDSRWSYSDIFRSIPNSLRVSSIFERIRYLDVDLLRVHDANRRAAVRGRR